MLSEELVEIAKKVYTQKSEQQNLEVKAAHGGCPRRLYDTLSSFSNQDMGGIILFGLDENQGFQPVGVYNLQDLQKKVTEQCNQMIPPVRAVFTTSEFMGVPICCAEIPSIELDQRPCYYAGVGKVKGSYTRVGDADLPMTDYEIYSFENYKKRIYDEQRKVENASFDCFRMAELERYIANMKADRPGFSNLNEKRIYEMLSITKNHIPTLASVMNFAIYPQGYFPQLAITAIVVPGRELGETSEAGSRFIDNKRIEGTLEEMLEGALAFCRRNMKTETIIDSNTGKRIDRTEYPINAVREAILNALVHRDYSIYTEGTPIQIDFFSDRLEIHSPGGLYGHLTIEELGYARPDLRNPALVTMSEFLLNTENRYSGIPTIYREMEMMGLPKPIFENRRNEFVVILYNKTRQENDDVHNLLSYCKTPRTRQEIKEFMNIQTSSYLTRIYLQPLIDAGKLKLTIPDKPRSKNQQYYS